MASIYAASLPEDVDGYEPSDSTEMTREMVSCPECGDLIYAADGCPVCDRYPRMDGEENR